MRSLVCFTLAAPLLALACSTGAPPPDITPPSPPLPAPQAAEPAAAPAVAGKWTSPSCGPRTYERRLSLEADGSFIAEDRVSPCPPGVACVWAGIVWRRGSYTVANGSIQLTAATSTSGPGKPFPLTLAIDPQTSAPVEVVSEGERCVYSRMP